jgi:hypothetical protein
MADIYGSANVVLVWLESVGESADVTRAFKFVHNAAAYEDSEHSVYKYSRAQISNSERERNWLAVENLCKLRYWTRKWIIQELVTARTVVLQAGNSKCTMADFETFCHQLHQNKDTVTYKQLSNTRPEICSVVVASPAARLALQRTETNNQQQPRLLHELIERYASSECHDPCDHIYALYSLAGEHRRHLSIEYAASPVRRLVMVLHFVHTHERMQPSKVLEFTNLLMRLFKIRPDDFLQERGLSENLDLVVPATLLGTVELQPESQGSMAMRREVKPLHPMSSFVLDTSRDIWVLTVNDDPAGSQERVGRDDMRYFSIADSGFHGLAACRLEAGDTIWHFPTTHLVFAVRSSSDHRAAVVGRAYLFSVTSNPDAPEPWLRRPFDYNRVRQGERNISMSLARLLEISSLAMSTKEVKLDPKKNVKRSGLRNMRIRWPLKMKTSWPMTDVQGMLEINRTHILVIAGSSKSAYSHDLRSAVRARS